MNCCGLALTNVTGRQDVRMATLRASVPLSQLGVDRIKPLLAGTIVEGAF